MWAIIPTGIVYWMTVGPEAAKAIISNMIRFVVGG